MIYFICLNQNHSLDLFDFDQDDETDYHDSRRSRRRFEEELEAEVRAEKRIINAKKVLLLELLSKFPFNFFHKSFVLLIPFPLGYQPQGHRDIPHKLSSLPAAKSSRRPVDFSESEREESEYETDGEEDERSPPFKRVEEPEQDYEEDEEEEPDMNRASEDEEEAEVCQCFECFNVWVFLLDA